jgi:hypothetical protein
MFDQFKKKAAGLTQKALVKMGKAEEFKEDDDFVKTIENFKQTRLGLIDIMEKGKAMIDAQDEATTAKIAYFERIIEFSGKQQTLDPRVAKYAEALKRYEGYTKEFWTNVAKTVLVPQSEFIEGEVHNTREHKNTLSETRTLRDGANRERVSKDSQSFKTEKAAAEWKRLDDQYQSDRTLLLEHVAYIEKKKNNDLLKNITLLFKEQYNMHATAYSDMATLETEVQQANEQALAAEASNPPPTPFTGAAPPPGSTSSASTPSAPAHAPPPVPPKDDSITG